MLPPPARAIHVGPTEASTVTTRTYRYLYSLDSRPGRSWGWPGLPALHSPHCPPPRLGQAPVCPGSCRCPISLERVRPARLCSFLETKTSRSQFAGHRCTRIPHHSTSPGRFQSTYFKTTMPADIVTDWLPFDAQEPKKRRAELVCTGCHNKKIKCDLQVWCTSISMLPWCRLSQTVNHSFLP